MTPPLIRRFSVGDRVYVRAQQVWMILVAHVMSTGELKRAERLITYGELATRMGGDPRGGIALGRELGIVGAYCIQNNLPALNCLVINQSTGTPGHNVLTRDSKSWKDEAWEAMRTNWFKFRVPTTGTFRQVWEEMSEAA